MSHRLLRVLAGALQRLLTMNKRAAARLKPYVSPSDVQIFERYDRVVGRLARTAPTPLVVDIGGGKACSFAHELDRRNGTRLVAVDVSEAELAHNRDVDDRRVANVVAGLPFADGEVGVIASRTVLEHVPDVDAFVRHSSRVLAPDGAAVHLIPCRYALFAVAARVIPFELARAILHRLRPEAAGVVEFPVYYDRGHPAAMRETLLRHGFRDVDIQVSYSQADYFDAFLPAYLAVGLYERVLEALDVPRLAAYMLVVARRDGSPAS